MTTAKIKVVQPAIVKIKVAKAGVQGVPGPKGDTGNTGPKGDKGDKGDTGERGLQGLKGDTGAASTVPGPKGDTGTTGAKGDKGDKGDTGAASTVPGPKGDTGEQGIQGLKGDQGDIGPQGDQGDIGPKGDKGDKGDQGDPGLNGEDGKDGAGISFSGDVPTYADLPTDLSLEDAGNAYLVLADGLLYVWSGSSFPPDTQGVAFQGERGPQGIQGLKGDKGDPGQDGASGAAPAPPVSNHELVYGTDMLGVVGWVPKLHYVGATLWPAGNHTATIDVGGPSFRGVQLRDAEEFGQQFFSPSTPDRILIQSDGWYALNFGVSLTAVEAARIYRARVFKSGNGIVENLTGRSSQYVSTATYPGSVDLSASSPPIFFRAGEFLRLGVATQATSGLLASSVDVLGLARSTFFNIKRVK